MKLEKRSNNAFEEWNLVRISLILAKLKQTLCDKKNIEKLWQDHSTLCCFKLSHWPFKSFYKPYLYEYDIWTS